MDKTLQAAVVFLMVLSLGSISGCHISSLSEHRELKNSENELAASLQDPDADVRQRAAASAAVWLAAMLADSDPDVHERGVRVLKDMGASAAVLVQQVAALLKDSDPRIRRDAVDAFVRLGPAGAAYAPQIAALMQNPDPYVRHSAAWALGDMGTAAAAVAPQVAALLKDSNPDIRRDAVDALGRLGTAGAAYAPQIAALIQDPNPDVRHNVVVALQIMGAAAVPITPQLTTGDGTGHDPVQTTATQMSFPPLKRVDLHFFSFDRRTGFYERTRISIRCTKGALECRFHRTTTSTYEYDGHTIYIKRYPQKRRSVNRKRLDALVVALRQPIVTPLTFVGPTPSDAEKMARESINYDKLSLEQRALLGDTLRSATKFEAALNKGFSLDVPEIVISESGYGSGGTVTLVDGSKISLSVGRSFCGFWKPVGTTDQGGDNYSDSITITLASILQPDILRHYAVRLPSNSSMGGIDVSCLWHGVLMALGLSSDEADAALAKRAPGSP